MFQAGRKSSVMLCYVCVFFFIYESRQLLAYCLDANDNSIQYNTVSVVSQVGDQVGETGLELGSLGLKPLNSGPMERLCDI